MSYQPFLRGKLIPLLVMCILFAPFSLFAQDFLLKGNVCDANNLPLIGASVIEKGTKNGSVTDLDGNFKLKVAPNSTLTVSYIGYLTETIQLKNQKTIKINLREDSKMLDETVVIGYGSLKKSDLTGAISSISGSSLSKRTTTNPAEALQSKVSGVTVRKAGGNAGATVQVKIRGVKTYGSNEPYYIIDGFPGDINNVNPSDIESMEVLKDGAAAAIYGSRAANGVIIVTTKNGKKGETKIDFNSFITSTQIANKLEMLDAKGYVQVHKQMYENYNKQWVGYEKNIPAYITTPSDVNTDWQKEMMRDGFAQNYMISARGGSDVAKYSISYNHADEKGIMLGNDFKQDNARAKITMKKYIFDIDANLSFRLTDNQQPRYSMKEMYMISPLVPIYDKTAESGYALTNKNGIPNNRNVMADYNFRKGSNKTYDTNANISLGMNFTDWLVFKTSYGYRGVHNRTTSHTPKYLADRKSPNQFPYNQEQTSYWEEQVLDNTLTFNKKIDQHSVNAMIGSSVTSSTRTWNAIGVEGKTTIYQVKDGKLETTIIPAGFIDDSYETIDAGNGGTFSGSGSNSKYNRASFFGRLNYTYASRYLVQATIRRDGSSKFGKNSRWGTFPSVALGWRISEENFFPKNTVIDNLKLRASWGRLGNEVALGYYDFISLIQTSNDMYQGYVQGSGSNPWPGSIATSLSNLNLKWETTDSKNVGVDFNLFNNRLSGALNYYYNQTEDLLITKKLAPSAGFYDPIVNVGKIRNSGIELELNWADSKNGFDYGVGFNCTTTKNKVVNLADKGQSLPGEGLKFGSEHFPTNTKVGLPIGAFFLYRTDGIFQSDAEANAYKNKSGSKMQPDAAAGDIRFKDINGDGVINENDKEYCGSGIPSFEANISGNVAYKGIDFSFLIGSGWGNKLYNGNRYFYEAMSSGTNMLSSTLKAWTPTNTNTSVPRAVYADYNGNSRESDRFLENGDFIRLRQIQLGYTLPKNLIKKAYIESLRFYVSGDNLLTWTNYSGVDPEFSRTSVLDTGIDNHIYPFTRSFSAGLQLTF